MTGRLVGAAAASLALVIAGCGHRKPGACTVTCADDSLCPESTSCGSDGYCHAAGDGQVCSSIFDRPDGGGGDGLADADPGSGDAEPPLDADPCAGVPNRAAEFDDNLYLIPDGDTAGIDLTLSIGNDCVRVNTVQVYVQIQHTYRGDVEIWLTSPGGDIELVLPSSNDSGDDINREFDVDVAVGESAAGDWVLNVSDVLAEYTGLVAYWSIGINRAAP